MRFQFRRSLASVLLALAAIAGLAAEPALASNAADGKPRHASSLFGDVKYGPEFEHFDYVNPDAPKGGAFRFGVSGGFDTLNPFYYQGVPAAGISSFVIERLMTESADEAASEYPLIAESIAYPSDFSSVTFTLNPAARFHDGHPITAEDVAWSFEKLTDIHPRFAYYYADVEKPVVIDDHTIRFEFKVSGNRELPQIMSQLPVLPKHYWTGTDKDGTPRDIGKTTLEPPLGSGPYKVGKVDSGRSIALERVEDYWGRDLPVNVGQNNFDTLEFVYFLDGNVAFEAFKGGKLDLRIESSAKRWATEYNFPAVRDGKVEVTTFSSVNAEPMQAFVFNTRRAKFADKRVRRAFNYAFDFEWANRNIFHDQYVRTASYFENSELAATGLPEGRELELLEPHRDKLPAELFTEPYENPKTDGSGNNRANLRKATDFLKEAGWVVENGRLINADTGEAMTIEFLINAPEAPTWERIVQPYVQSLKRLGVEATIRSVDTAQYQARIDKFDFDAIIDIFGQSLSPGNEQRDFWSCATKDRDASQNTIGICDPVVDALIEKLIQAKSRADLVAATQALDRVLQWGWYVVPQWHYGKTRVAYWKHIAHPESMPTHSPSAGVPSIWWRVEGE